MAYDEPWKLSEDGFLNVDVDSDSIIYHPNLNIILVSTKSSEVHVIDVNSGVILQTSSLSGNGKSTILGLRGTYIVGHDKILYTNGRGIGVRRDYNGVLLLDTILQTPVSKPEEVVKLELLLSEAILLQQSLKCVELPGVDHTAEVLAELAKKIREGQEKPKTGTKAQKWSSVCLELPHLALKLVCAGMVQELKRQNRHIPALSIASAVNERLGCLLPTYGDAVPPERCHMFSEAVRIDTFVKWPHMHYKWALPEHMAQAGFYHQPNSTGDDRAMCFTCNVCLVCWEPTDEPWSEHERHSPSCPFVKGEYTQNVPLSVTYATSPATPLASQDDEELSCVGTSSVADLVATATRRGLIVVWNVARQLKKDVCLVVSPAEITKQTREVWPWKLSQVAPTADIGDIPLPDTRVKESVSACCQDLDLTAVSVVGGPLHQLLPRQFAAKPTSGTQTASRPCVVAGVSTTRMEAAWGGANGGRHDANSSPMVRAMNDVNEASSRQAPVLDIMKVSHERASTSRETSLYLIVYDFHYSRAGDGGDGGKGGGGKSPQTGSNPKKLISGTGTSASTSGTRLENNNMYQEIFLSKFLYDVPVMDDVDTDVVMGGTHPDDVLDFTMPSSSGGSYAPQSMLSHDAAAMVSFSTVNGNVVFPSTSDAGSPPPLLIKVNRSNKKDGSVGQAEGQSTECQRTKRDEPCAVQCIPLPDEYRDRDDLSVLGIHPTRDGGHLLVVLGPPHTQHCDTNKPNGLVDVSLEHSFAIPRTTYQLAQDFEAAYRAAGSSKPSSGISVLLVYSLDMSGAVVRLSEVPSSVRELSAWECPSEVLLLPLAEREDEDGETEETQVKGVPQGQAALVCRDGRVRIIDVATLQTVAEASPQGEGVKFVSAAYCNSLERLCACTDHGSLHFFVMHDSAEDVAHVSDHESVLGPADADPQVFAIDVDPRDLSPTSSASAAQSPTGSCPSSDLQLLVNRPTFDLAELRALHELTRHENLSPLFSATVPPCWTEMMQAQKQRRHPQHLQQGDEVQHTRSWRLQNDATTWDEHVLEMTLPRNSCSVGHVDVKFSLHAPCHSPPNVQVTLLKQNANAIGRKETLFASDAVDHRVDFNLANTYASHMPACASVNPVTTQEYLREHNTEVLCGPVNLSSCLDLSDQGGSVTLTSPVLFNTRGRTLLLHIKAISDDSDKEGKADQGTSKGRASEEKAAVKKSRLDNLHSLSLMDRLSVTAQLNKSTQCYLGCDWLHEVSVTIRRTKQTSLPHERVQRSVMLESGSFVEKLLHICLEGCDRAAQGVALDILIWVASVRLGRHRSTRAHVRTQQHDFSRTVERHLGALVQRCILLAGRSIAHKCVKLIVICSEGMKNAVDSVTVQFDACVLRALLEWLPLVLGARSAGSLRWYFLLLSRVMALDVSATAGQKCVALLQQVAQELGKRANPYHMLLRTRFGLYGTPFEPELFDLEPPVSAKSTSMPVTYATVVSNSNETPAGASVSLGTAPPVPLDAGADTLDLRELLALPGAGLVDMVKGIPARLKGLSSNHYMKGLLEVEPLHFTCHAASDGTKMEKIEAGVGAAAAGLNVANFFDPNNFVTTNAGTKVADNDFIDLKTLKELVKGKKVKSKLSTVIIELDKFDKSKNSETSSSSSSQLSTVSGPAAFQSTSTAQETTALLKEAFVDMTKRAEERTDENPGTLPWQQLLVPQPQHMLVIERMHSGARRFAVIDFGRPVLLTDLIVPSCADLVSLSVDIWCHGEEVDGQRLVVAADIGTKSLVMSDLQPPPICRYLKITTIGRYGMSTTRCRIPLGSFFGHTLVLPGESSSDPTEEASASGVAAQLPVLAALHEDVHCRYSLACAKLREMLEPLMAEEMPNVVHMHHYLQHGREADKLFPNAEAQRILSAFRECSTFQRQLNLVRSVMLRLESAAQGKEAPLTLASSATDVRDAPAMLRAACSDKLRVVGEGLLDILLYLAYEIGPVPRLPVSLYHTFDQSTCAQLFERLCVGEDTRMQLATCTLLVRMCGLQPWWGNFLADTLTTFYSSQHSTTFPQDRVFLLVSYLGRKSLAGGSPRSCVIDSVLATLSRLLAPLANNQPGFLRAQMDLSLVGWILLFLSVCLDAGASGAKETEETDKGKEQQVSTTRWDFIQGEVAMQKRLATANRSNASKSYRRKLQKRLMHHKQQLEDLEAAKKAFHASTQALSALSSQAANLSSKLEAALKQHEQVFKKTLKQHSAKVRRSDLPGAASKPPAASSTPRQPQREETASEAMLCLPAEHCLPVARGLISLILQMDFTCNIDMFLLACKVVARLVVSTRHCITLVELMTEDQLVRMVRLAVWNDQHKGSWGGPWAAHAICCLLQDILEGTRAYPAPQPSSTPQLAPPSTPPPDPLPRSDPVEFPTIEESNATTAAVAAALPSTNSGPSTSKANNNNNFQLPSLMESDDSELEDFLDDILERGRNLLKRGNSNRVVVSASSSISTALDARLEYGVEGGAEVTLKRLTALGAYNLPLSVNAAIQAPPEAARQPSTAAWDAGMLAERVPPYDNMPCDSHQMLTNCFDAIFSELHKQNCWTNLELALQMWVTLNVEATQAETYCYAITPTILMSQHAASGLIAALAWHPGITLRTWSLAFQCLTLLSNTVYIHAYSAELSQQWRPETEEDYDLSLSAMGRALAGDARFVPMLLRFLSGSGLSTSTCAGPSVCVAFHDLLALLEMRCDVISPDSHFGNLLKDSLLSLVHQLVQPSGALANRQGPLDAQCKLLEMLLHLDFDNADVGTCFNIVDAVGMLAYTYILSVERVKCRSVSESGVAASSCFGGLFASVLGGEAKQGRPATWDALLCSLLKLTNKLVQIPLRPREGEETGGYLADTVLTHQPTMLRLLSALAGCSGSTLAMLLGSTSPPERLSHDELGEPLSVGDAVFQLLSVLARKAASPRLVLRPALDFLSSAGRMPGAAGVTQLSEPLLWFVLRLVDNEQALETFAEMGGVAVVGENLVRSNVALVNAHPSLVSVIMQHFSHASGSAGVSTKKTAGAETCEGLLNFAPLGTISSSNPTAQPADILIQSAPPHRRARTPQWSYHFYPDETWVDLTMSLPCAVLLKEVQLQPHLTSLATCPSAVAIEVCRDGAMVPVPACPPLDTAGLTFIRLAMPQPEVVTSVLVRLYKPRDSSNIGLSQIRLLGSTTFGEASFRTVNVDVPDEELLTKSSLGWLRLLHHCACLPPQDSTLSKVVLDHVAKVPQILEACCGLLLIPAPSPVLFTPSLERVLLKLGLHSRELGLRLIDTLLRNGAAAFVQGSLQSGGRTAVVDSVVELIYQLCTTQDHAVQDRVSALLDWLGEVARDHVRTPSAAYVRGAAAVLWAAREQATAYDLADMVTEELFDSLVDWTADLAAHSALKKSIDAVLCAACYVKPTLFPALLRRMGVLIANDEGSEVLVEFHQLALTECQLMTIGMACQSPPAVVQLLESGLPTLLTKGIVEFCRRERCKDDAPEPNHIPMLRADSVATVLDFLAEVCSEGRMQDWLGSEDGCRFWLPLLSLLCNKCPAAGRDAGDGYAPLEAAAVKFLSRCCRCHEANQRLLAVALCDVISQQRSVVHDVTYLHGVSGFTRRIVLQLLLENEKVLVFVKASVPLSRGGGPAVGAGCSYHPRYGAGHECRLMLLTTQTTVADILKLVSVAGNILPLICEGKTELFGEGVGKGKDVWDVGLGLVEQMSLTAGATAKDKRAKDVKNAAAAGSRSTPYAKRSRANSALDFGASTSAVVPGLSMPQSILTHEACADVALPATMTLSQLMHMVCTESETAPSAPGCLTLTLVQQSKNNEEDITKNTSQGSKLLWMPSLLTPLQVFSQAGGLALLAQHLPLVYPETLRCCNSDKPVTQLTAEQAMEAEWIKVEASDDMYEDLDDSLPAGSSSPGGRGNPLLPSPSVPPHSLAAFGLFLRLPGYADVLLRDRKKAQCLLRLVLGVTDDGEGGDIFNLPVASSLHTLPFQVLRQLLDSTPLSSDDGALLRRTAVDIGAIHLLLGCLSVFTHQQQDIALPNVQHDVVIAATKTTVPERSKSDDKSHLYWAKGTGFGTGSTAQSWNVEQALMRQRSEEEHVTVLLQVLSCFINPGSCAPAHFSDEDDDDSSVSDDDSSPSPRLLPPSFHDLVEQSCLLPAVSSYLRNDSVLDMARHIPLYRAVLQLLRAMAYDERLAAMLLPPDARHVAKRARADDLSVVCLLTKMKKVVDTYAFRLKFNKSRGRNAANKFPDEVESDEGLALFIFDIQETASLVQLATSRLVMDDEPDGDAHSAPVEFPLGRSLEERYLEVMKRLQFDSFEMITECAEGGFQYVVSYHFESNMRAAGDRCHPSRVKRLAQETVTLSTSLPLSYSSSVFVRCDADRLDVMKVLITGPAETPYANGCFEFDVYFPPEYPNAPMMINLETTGHHTIRFNPNLYNDGKVCLSVLNTWHGRPEEKWNAQTSSFLQVLVSIQSLILVPEPYFNEPGYERSRGTPSGNQSSKEYNSNICQATVKWAMLEQVKNPCPCFKDVIHTHFWMKRAEIVTQVEGWIADMESQCGDRRTGRAISLNAMALKRHYRQLREELSKLPTPEGLSDLADSALLDLSPAVSPDSKDVTPSSTPTDSATGNNHLLDSVAVPTSHYPLTPLTTTKLDNVDHDTDIDMEMEKMVSKVCE